MWIWVWSRSYNQLSFCGYGRYNKRTFLRVNTNNLSLLFIFSSWFHEWSTVITHRTYPYDDKIHSLRYFLESRIHFERWNSVFSIYRCIFAWKWMNWERWLIRMNLSTWIQDQSNAFDLFDLFEKAIEFIKKIKAKTTNYLEIKVLTHLFSRI